MSRLFLYAVERCFDQQDLVDAKASLQHAGDAAAGCASQHTCQENPQGSGSELSYTPR